MDPAGLLISIATIALTIDQINETYASSSKTLALIRAQIRILETGTQRIQEWLHFTDPTSQAQVSRSLHDSIATVNSSIESLQEDLDHITRSGPKASKMLGRAGSDQWTKAKFAMNENRLRKHLTDVRECASLIHFTLSVCQLPVGKTAAQEVRELEIGAQTLSRAHKSTRQVRRGVLAIEDVVCAEERSDDFNTFMRSVQDAEQDLPADSPVEPRLSRQDSSMSSTDTAAKEGTNLDGGPMSHSPPQAKERLFLRDSPSPPQFAQEGMRVPEEDELFLDDQGLSHAQPQDHTETSLTPTGRQRQLVADQEGLIPVQRHERFNIHEQQQMPVRPLNVTKRQSSSSYFPPISATPPLPPKVFEEEPAQIGQAISGPAVRKPITRKPIRGMSVSEESAAITPQVRQPTTPKDESFAPGDIGVASPMPEKLATNGKRQAYDEPLEAYGGPFASSSSVDLATQNPSQQNVVYEPFDDPPPYHRQPLSSPALRQLKSSETPIQQYVNGDNSPYLITLVRQGRVDEIRDTLQSGVNIDEVHPSTQRTAVMEAAHFGQTAICALLVKAGARLHLKDADGCTALHLAASRGDTEICQVLLDGGAELEFADNRGKTPLELAAASGNSVHTVVFLLSRAPKRKTNDPLLLKAFYEVVKVGSVGMAQAFLSSEVKPKKIKESWKPAAYAAQSGNTQMLDFVITQKCSLKDKSPDGSTPLHWAARHGHPTMVEKLLDQKVAWKGETKKRKETALHLAILAGHTATALALIQHKDASVSMRDRDNQEPMHHAIRNGDAAVVAALMAKGAKAKTANSYGWEPMVSGILKTTLNSSEGEARHVLGIFSSEDPALRCQKVPPEVFSDHCRRIQQAEEPELSRKYLHLLFGLCPHMVSAPVLTMTFQHLAAAYGHTALAAELMTRGVSIEDKLTTSAFKPAKRTNEAARKGFIAEARWPHIGVRPLHLALEFGHDEVASMLVSAGAKVDESDSRGWRPLHHAAFACRAAMVDLLLGKGASPHATTDDGNTPLALGFREYSISARAEDTWRVRELLGSAMESQKKSKMKQFTGFMSGGGGSRTASERNKAWYNAEAAIALAQEAGNDEGEEDEESQQTSEAGLDIDGDSIAQSRATSALSSVSSRSRGGSTPMIEGPDSYHRMRAMS